MEEREIKLKFCCSKRFCLTMAEYKKKVHSMIDILFIH